MSNASAVSPHAGREGQHRNGAVAPRLSCRHGTADTPGPDRRLTVRTAPDSSAGLSGRRTGPGTRHSHRRRRALRALGASPPAATRTCGSPRGNSWRARGVTLHQAERRRCNVVTRLAGSTGFEPATSGLTVQCANQAAPRARDATTRGYTTPSWKARARYPGSVVDCPQTVGSSPHPPGGDAVTEDRACCHARTMRG